ncbi:hypothetical protein, partial [Deinococcus sp. Leaf326]|uniref:hypothetical protein n=1 Tax=Deinococcus sp. Leaf326 TaxID=1736338 RepID=UPI001F2EE4C4
LFALFVRQSAGTSGRDGGLEGALLVQPRDPSANRVDGDPEVLCDGLAGEGPLLQPFFCSEAAFFLLGTGEF